MKTQLDVYKSDFEAEQTAKNETLRERRNLLDQVEILTQENQKLQSGSESRSSGQRSAGNEQEVNFLDTITSGLKSVFVQLNPDEWKSREQCKSRAE